MSTVTESGQAPATAERHYGLSALATGFVRVWKGAALFWLVIIVNAVLQALIALPYDGPGFSLAGLGAVLVSFALLLVTAGLTVAGALESATGRATIRGARGRLRAREGLFTLWFVLLIVALALGGILYLVPGLIIVALTPYVLFAALDGHANALGPNFRALGARWGRWLVTVLVMGLILLVSWLLAALSAFFITGVVSAVITWLWFGFLLAWFSCAWAAIYRSTPAGAAPAA